MSRIGMTPRELLAALLEMNEEQGRLLLSQQIQLLRENAINRLATMLKRETDRNWNRHARRSLILAGHLMLLGELVQDRSIYAQGLMAHGDALRRLDQDSAALPFFDVAGEEFLSLGDEVSWARSRISRVSACLRLNRTTEALRDAAQAYEIFVRYGKFIRAGQIDVNAAMVYYERGQYEEALHLFDRAIASYQQDEHEVDLYLARAYGNKALALAAMGRFRDALMLHEQARTIFSAYGVQEEISLAREDLNMADIYAVQGHYSQALLLYQHSRNIFLQHEMALAAAEVAQQMCSCLLHLNRIQEAYDLTDEVVMFLRETGAPPENLARSLMQKARVATLSQRLAEAGEMLQEAICLLDECGSDRLAALARFHRAELYFAHRQLAESEQEIQFVLEAFTQQEDLPHLAQAQLLLARIAYAQTHYAQARTACQQALSIVQRQELLDVQYACFDLLGQLAQHQSLYEEAAHFYDQALQSIDEIQSRLVLDERTSFLEDKKGIYQRAIALAWQRHHIDQAFTYIEKSKSRVLSDYLRQTIDIRFRTTEHVDATLWEELVHLREEQAWFSAIVHHTIDETRMGESTLARMQAIRPDEARREMRQREREIERLLEHVQLLSANNHPEQISVSEKNDSALLLSTQLPPDVLLLEYYLSEHDLFIFQVTCLGLQAYHEANVVEQIERLITLWRTNLDFAGQAAGTAGFTDDYNAFPHLIANCQGLLQRLYRLLLKPVEDEMAQYKQVIIVPYGMLHYIPFHCLYDGQNYCIEKNDISYLPSAALYSICTQRGQHIHLHGIQRKRSLVLGSSERGLLPYAIREAESVARLIGVPALLDEAATATYLDDHGSWYHLIHIAAHGLFRLDAPGFSYIQLADRQLSTIDVFNLDLSSCTLIVLSACETGRSVIAGIDEVIGLGRGFLYAGAASLLPTLWKVDDRSSAHLMEHFYQHLLAGSPKAEALAHAQRSFLSHARTFSKEIHLQHPYFWGAFHLIGDPGPL